MAAVTVQHIQRDGAFAAPSAVPYWLTIVSRDPALTVQDVARVAAQIAATQVRWVAAWGYAFRQWEDALDGEIEWRMATGTCPEPACTTSHDEEEEALADVLALTREVAHRAGARPEDIHVLVVGGPTVGLAELLCSPESDA